MANVYQAYVAGEWRQTSDRRELRAPWDGSVFATVSFCGRAEIEEAAQAASRAFELTRKLPSYQRAQICHDVARGLVARKEELAQGLCVEGGKPILDARAEVDRAAHCFELAAVEAERLGGEVFPLDLRPTSAGRLALTRRVPVGPVAAISPYNFPLNLGVHKVAPAIAAGCPVVLKPASATPTSSLRLAELIEQTSWPKGALSVVPSPNTVADAMVTDERFRFLSFTGSAEVGWGMKARAGTKKVALELGGNAAVVVDEGADLDFALPRIVYGSFSYAGQKCISVQRVLVHERLFGAFVDRLVQATARVKVGDPRDPEVLVGPVIDEGNARRIEGWVEQARARGAKVLAGGERRRNLLPAFILANVPHDADVSCKEVFGPLVTVEPFSSFAEALRTVNDSPYGLQAGVFTESLDHALEAWDELEVGGVILNDTPTYRIDHMPYGGVKGSGQGREGIRYALEEMTELRLLAINRDHHAKG